MERKTVNNRAIYVAMVLVASSCCGIVTPLMKVAHQHGFTVGDVTDSQYAMASVLLWAIAVFWRKGARIPLKQWVLLMVLGMVGAGTSYTDL